ncbi:unnamed protein product [Darwinula stevensoni]|uniref:Uncharacterized protein n=1 Tax=Darwinula stevensoni TaxID=69355 RepID=A0A7R9AA59_9CRUS|nr:unnamed protein product [Darwinula stevensoni]CAG0898103.1 unnamed protein product [Darwinula stevensoni]
MEVNEKAIWINGYVAYSSSFIPLKKVKGILFPPAEGENDATNVTEDIWMKYAVNEEVLHEDMVMHLDILLTGPEIFMVNSLVMGFCALRGYTKALTAAGRILHSGVSGGFKIPIGQVVLLPHCPLSNIARIILAFSPNSALMSLYNASKIPTIGYADGWCNRVWSRMAAVMNESWSPLIHDAEEEHWEALFCKLPVEGGPFSF